MLFNSLQFAIFLPVVFAIYWLLPHRYRWVLLLLSSYYFYMSWNAKYVALILLTTLVSYLAAILIEKTDSQKKRKTVLSAALIVCLGVLFVFKYFNFFFSSVSAVLSSISIHLQETTLKLLLPVGISFYTFQTLSYVIDVYRGDIKAEKHFGIYAAFVSFFPQLVAGPIERTENLLPQIKEEHNFDYDTASYGLKLMGWGFFKKIVISDNMAWLADRVFDTPSSYSGFALILAALFFTIQIYCDFSGYTDIARGTANLFGIRLMDNFQSPYFSSGIKEFWSRWHISLSTWFRDYLYIPLGGNRCSRLRNYFNLLVTFLVSGLWHGANWTFVIWGGIHGLGQIAEKALHVKQDTKLKKIAGRIGTFIFVMLAWIFFRAQTVRDALYFFANMFKGIASPISYFTAGFFALEMSVRTIAKVLLLYFLPLAAFDFVSLKTDVIAKSSSLPVVIRWTVYFAFVAFILRYIIITGGSGGEFIYFQF